MTTYCGLHHKDMENTKIFDCSFVVFVVQSVIRTP